MSTKTKQILIETLRCVFRGVVIGITLVILGKYF